MNRVARWVGYPIVLLAVGILLIALFFPTLRTPAIVESRWDRKSDLKEMGYALDEYFDVHRKLPPAYVADDEGRPMHSWRVLILPFLGDGYENLYDAYDFSQPWDSPTNRQLLDQMPREFRAYYERDDDGHLTDYLAVTGPRCMFQGSEGVTYRDVPDGTSYTVMIVEAAGSGVPWTKPSDLPLRLPIRPNTLGGARAQGDEDGAFMLFADGSVHFMRRSTDPDLLRRLLIRDDGEPINDWP